MQVSQCKKSRLHSLNLLRLLFLLSFMDRSVTNTAANIHVGLRFLLFFLVPLSQYLAYFILLYILCHSPTCMCYALWAKAINFEL